MTALEATTEFEALRRTVTPVPDPFPQRWCSDARARLESRLAEESAALSANLDGISEVVARAIGTEGRGGGRWRPLLTLASAEACGRGDDAAMDAAVAVELTHTASLVLDDLPCMDDAPLRRGQPATHRLVGSSGAILLSVGLLARSAELLGRTPGCGGDLAREWGRSFGMAGMAGGQAVDVTGGGTPGPRRRLLRAKSTLLPALALGAGARVAHASHEVRDGLEAFGRALGWAYQLLDDVADAEEDAARGYAPTSLDPMRHSRRLLRLGTRRLHKLSGLRDEGRAVLLELADRVVASEVSSAAGAHAVQG